jgi:hypothetical protein
METQKDGLCSKCGKTADSCFKYYNGDNYCNYCEYCFKTYVAKPCYRCGEACDSPMNEKDKYDSEYNVVGYYWECSTCQDIHWCTLCGEIDPDYDIHADYYGRRNGKCQNCVLKTELDKMNCNCECGEEGTFYSKNKKKWLCIDCVIQHYY